MGNADRTLNLPKPHVLVAGAALLAAPLLAWAVVSAPRVAALGMVTLVLGCTLVLRPHWGVFAMLAGSLFNEVNLDVGFALLGVGDAAMLAVLPTWTLYRLMRPDELRLPRAWGFGVMALVWLLISVILGVAPAIAWGAYLRTVLGAAAIVAIVDLLRTEEQLVRALQALVLMGTVHALIALPEAGSGRRIRGLVDQPNLLGLRLACGIIPAAGLLLRAGSFARAVYLGALSLMLVAVVLTISRGTYIGLGVAFLWWMRDRRRLIIVMLLAAGGASYLLDLEEDRRADVIAERFEMSDESAKNRWQVVLNALKVTASHPVLGVGYAQFTELDRSVTVARQSKRGAHNTYLALAASSGIPGLLLVMGFVWAQARALWRRRKRLAEEGAHSAVQIVSIFQALLIYHFVSLLVRGATPIDLVVLGCCGAAGMLVAAPPASEPEPTSAQSPAEA